MESEAAQGGARAGAEHEAADPWRRHERQQVVSLPRMTVWRDWVTTPARQPGLYDWVETADTVRVAVVVEAAVLLVEQHHYLVGTGLQLPGGAIDPQDADALAAARREVREETGYHGGQWHRAGVVCPLPALTPSRAHLYIARDVVAGTPHLEPAEADVVVHRVELAEVPTLITSGRLVCAASMVLLQMLTA